MSTYKISGDHTAENKGNGTAESPYILSKGNGFADIQTINLGNCYAELTKFIEHGNITKVEGGKITNTNGYDMFNGCTSLTTFTSDLSNLDRGRYMFQNCTSLTTFSSDLSSLTNSESMFRGCTTLQSVKIKCSTENKDMMTKAKLYIRSEAVLEVSTDNGATWETINE